MGPPVEDHSPPPEKLLKKHLIKQNGTGFCPLTMLVQDVLVGDQAASVFTAFSKLLLLKMEAIASTLEAVYVGGHR